MKNIFLCALCMAIGSTFLSAQKLRTKTASFSFVNLPIIHPPLDIVRQGNKAIIDYFETTDNSRQLSD